MTFIANAFSERLIRTPGTWAGAAAATNVNLWLKSIPDRSSSIKGTFSTRSCLVFHWQHLVALSLQPLQCSYQCRVCLVPSSRNRRGGSNAAGRDGFSTGGLQEGGLLHRQHGPWNGFQLDHSSHGGTGWADWFPGSLGASESQQKWVKKIENL